LKFTKSYISIKTSNGSIRSKTMIGITLLSLLILLSGVSSYFINSSMSKRENRYNKLIDENTLTASMISTLLLLESAVNGYILTGDNKQLDDFNYQSALAKHFIKRAQKEIKATQMKVVINTIRERIEKIDRDFSYINRLEYSKIMIVPDSIETIQHIHREFIYVKNSLQTAFLSMKSESDKLKREQLASSDNSSLIINSLFIAQLITVLFIGFHFFQFILKPLYKNKSISDSIFNSIPFTLIALDTELRVTKWNDGVIKTIESAESLILGEKIDDVFPIQDFDLEILRKVIKDHQIYSTIREVSLENHEVRIESLKICPLLDSNSKGAVILLEDITERERLKKSFITKV